MNTKTRSHFVTSREVGQLSISSCQSNSNSSDSKSSLGLNNLRNGVKEFFRKIHWQSSKTTMMTDDVIKKEDHSRQRGREKGEAVPISVHHVESTCQRMQEGYLEIAEREARRVHRRRRSSRTRSCERRRHYSSYFQQTPNEDQADGQSTEEKKQHESLEEHFLYGDIPSGPHEIGQELPDGIESAKNDSSERISSVDVIKPINNCTDNDNLRTTAIPANETKDIPEEAQQQNSIVDQNANLTEDSTKAKTSETEKLHLVNSPINFDESVTSQINSQHRQNMSYLDDYLEKVVDMITNHQKHPPIRLTLTPQLTPSLNPSATLEAPEESQRSTRKHLQDNKWTTRRPFKSPFTKPSKSTYFESIKNTFALATKSKGKGKICGEKLAKIKKAKSDRGPFWRVTIFEKNRAKNKARDNSYSVTFGFKFKTSQVGRRRLNLLRYKNLLKSKINQNHIQEKYHKSKKADLNKTYNFNKLGQDDSEGLVNCHNINYQPNNFEQFLPQLDLNVSSKNYDSEAKSKYLDEINQFKSKDYPNSKHFLNLLQSRMNKNGPNKYFTEFTLSPISTILQDSSKLSEKTKNLLEKVSSASSDSKSCAQKNKTKTYRPKTEFTRQFAQLLPSYNRDNFIFDQLT